jgi:ornithine cyclodeaminase
MYILSGEDVRRAVSMPDAIDAVANAFMQLSAERAYVPLRAHIGIKEQEATSFFMPAYVPAAEGSSASLGLKVVSVFPKNSARSVGTPTINAAVMLLDPQTGVPRALLDGTYLTALRTGASSGVATRELARPDSKVLALFGAGGQAAMQVLAVCSVRPIEQIWIYNRTRSKLPIFMAQLRALGAPIPSDIRVANTPAQALADADVVCCATSSPTPLFEDAHVRPGTHINGVGSYNPRLAEVPAQTIKRAYVVVDQREAAWSEAGDLIQARDAGIIAEQHAQVELGEVVAGTAPGRSDENQITFFKSVGNAVQDLAVGQLALERAIAGGFGTEVHL